MLQSLSLLVVVGFVIDGWNLRPVFPKGKNQRLIEYDSRTIKKFCDDRYKISYFRLFATTDNDLSTVKKHTNASVGLIDASGGPLPLPTNSTQTKRQNNQYFFDKILPLQISNLAYIPGYLSIGSSSVSNDLFEKSNNVTSSILGNLYEEVQRNVGLANANQDNVNIKNDIKDIKLRLEKIEKFVSANSKLPLSPVNKFIGSLQANTLVMNADTIYWGAIVGYYLIGWLIFLPLMNKLAPFVGLLFAYYASGIVK